MIHETDIRKAARPLITKLKERQPKVVKKSTQEVRIKIDSQVVSIPTLTPRKPNKNVGKFR